MASLFAALLFQVSLQAETTVGAETRFIKTGEPMLDVGNLTVVKQYLVDWKEGGGDYLSQDIGSGPFTSTFWINYGGGTSGVFGLELGLCVGGSADFDLGFQPMLIMPDKLVSGVPLPLTVETPILGDSDFQTRFPGIGNAYADLIFDARGKIDIEGHIPALPNVRFNPSVSTRDVKVNQFELVPSLRCDPAIFSPLAYSLPWPGWERQDSVTWGVEKPSVSNPNPRYYGVELASINRDNDNKFRHLNVGNGSDILQEPFKSYDFEINEDFAGGAGRVLIKNPIINTNSTAVPSRNTATMLRSDGEDEVFGLFVDIPQLVPLAFGLDFPLVDNGSVGPIDWDYIIASLEIGPVVKLGLDYELTWNVVIDDVIFDRNVKVLGKTGMSFSAMGIRDRELTNCGPLQIPPVELLDETPVNAEIRYKIVANLKTVVSAPIVARVDYKFLGVHAKAPYIGRIGLPVDGDAFIEDQHNFEMSSVRLYESNRQIEAPGVGSLSFTMESSGPATYQWAPVGSSDSRSWTDTDNWFEATTGLAIPVPDYSKDVSIPHSSPTIPVIDGFSNVSTLSLGYNSSLYIDAPSAGSAGLTVIDAFLENLGTISIQDSDSRLSLPGEVVTLCGPGSIFISGGSLQGATSRPEVCIINYNNILGGGFAFNQLDINSGTSKINNIGSIMATLVSPATPLQTNATTILNQEKMGAKSGGELQVRASSFQTGAGSSVVSDSFPSQVDLSILDTARHTGMIQALNGGSVTINSPTANTVFNAAQAINENTGQFFSTGQNSLLEIDGMLMLGGCFMASGGGDIKVDGTSFMDTVIRIGTYQNDALTSDEQFDTEGAVTITNSSVINYGNISVPDTLSVVNGKSFVNHGKVVVPSGGSLDIERFALELVKEGGVTETVYRPGSANALNDVLIGGTWDIGGELIIEEASFKKIGAAPAKSYSGSTYIDGDGISRQAVAAENDAEELAYGKPASVTLRGANWNFPAIETLEFNSGDFYLLDETSFNTDTDFSNMGLLYLGGSSTLNVNGAYAQSENDASTFVTDGSALNVSSNEYIIQGGRVRTFYDSTIFGRTGSDTVLDNIKLHIEAPPTLGFGNPEDHPVVIDLSIDSVSGDPDSYAKIETLAADAEVTLHGFVEFDALVYLQDIRGKLTYSGSGLTNHGEFDLQDPVVNGALSVLGHSTKLDVNSYLQESGSTTIGAGAMINSYGEFDVTGGDVVFEISERRPSRGEPSIGAPPTNGLIQTGGAFVTLGDSIVIKFLEGVNPQIGDSWPIVRGSITPERITANFEAARFEGAVPPAGTKFVLEREGYYLYAKVVIDGPSISYLDWIETNEIPDNMAGFYQDANGNGVINSIDFAFGGVSEASHAFMDVEGESLVEISFARTAGETLNVAYNIFARGTEDDAEWLLRNNFEQISVAPIDGTDLELVTLRETSSASNGRSQFRVEALMLGLPIDSENGETPDHPEGDVGYAGPHRGSIGKIIYAQVREKTNGVTTGTDRYRDNSNYDTTATHAGIIARKPSNSSSVVVKVTILERLDSYVGTEQNGVTSQSFEGPFEDGEVSFTMDLLTFDDYAFYRSAVIPSYRDPDNLPDVLNITEVRGLSEGTATLSITWESLPDIMYRIERSIDFLEWETIGSEYPSNGTTTSAEVEIDAASTTVFYRVTRVDEME